MLTGLQDDPSPGLFGQEVRNCAGGMVTLGLWSAKVMLSDGETF